MKLEMSMDQLAAVKEQVSDINRKTGDIGGSSELGKDSFLKLLITQLKHQDPTNPMEDREFIAQMAKFSSLEQMTNLNKELKTLIRSSESAEAYGLIGKEIDSYDPETSKRVSGIVSSVQYSGGAVRLMVNDNEVNINDIHIVREPAASSEGAGHRNETYQ